MPAWNRNEPLASKRRVTLAIYDIDGAPMSALFLTDGTPYTFLVEKSDGHYVAPAASLLNTDRPLVFADIAITADAGTDTISAVAHGLKTGDGPVFGMHVGGGALPGGIVALTPYWPIVTGDDEFQLAASLADALAGTFIDITSNGSGSNFIVDDASTTRLNDGIFAYEATQAEINYRGTRFGIMVFGDTIRLLEHNVDLRDEQQLHAGTAAAGAAGTVTLDAAASATNDLYKDCVVLIVGGTGAGQANTIASYVGGTKVATMARNWATNPDATSELVIVPAPSGANPTSVADAVWAKVLEGAHTAADLMRLAIGILAGAVADYSTGTYSYKSLNGAKTRSTHTATETGRGNPTIVDLT